MVWYPLGRPVGSTIYPGMQFTAVFINRFLLPGWSLNDVCCYLPAWFGALASCIVGMIAYECTLPSNSASNILKWLLDLANGQPSDSKVVRRPVVMGLTSPAVECGVFSMGMMAIVPAHLMRSVGGGYDNESVAVSAMTLTFYLWIRSLRDAKSAKLGFFAGLAYFYMVAAWGGYIFVINLIGVQAGMLVILGRFSDKVWLSYTLFYTVGTVLAIQVPVVGWAPLKSLEQLGPCGVFLGYQLLQLCEVMKRRQQLTRKQTWKLRIQVFGAAGAAFLLLVIVVAPSGYFGPISSRVRGLFVQHTKTGNPLVDSVAEHQPASSHAYFQYLHHVCSLAPLGFLMVLANLSDSSSFLVAWGITAYFFSHRMVRLILLTGPIGSALGGIAAGRLFAWCIRQWWDVDDSTASDSDDSNVPKAEVLLKKKKKIPKKQSVTTYSSGGGFDGLASFKTAMEGALASKEGVIAKRTVSCLVLILGYVLGVNFKQYCWRLSQDLSNPSIIVKARLKDGRVIKLDDYREAYWWLRDNTPEDSRIMAWWDYGYQITAISNRTTIADG
jgi:dolichyl-diphosphooligosaccharide---protein glycosyltransferase